MTASTLLSGLGIALPPVATPVGSYVPALRVGDLVFTSGQLPLLDGALIATGVVGDDDSAAVSTARACECARACTLNALAAAAEVAGGIDNIARVVKVTVFVASAPTYTSQPEVANGASDLLGAIFGDAGRHTRSAVGVAALPKNAPVELEMIVQVAS